MVSNLKGLEIRLKVCLARFKSNGQLLEYILDKLVTEYSRKVGT